MPDIILQIFLYKLFCRQIIFILLCIFDLICINEIYDVIKLLIFSKIFDCKRYYWYNYLILNFKIYNLRSDRLGVDNDFTYRSAQICTAYISCNNSFYLHNITFQKQTEASQACSACWPKQRLNYWHWPLGNIYR